jgi:hypothetical protein
MGGFMGADNSISIAGFADLVSAGDVRYVLVGQGGIGGGPGRVLPGAAAGIPPGDGFRQGVVPDGFGGAATSGPNAVMSAVQSACTAVSDTSLPAQYQGALYDCAGAAGVLRAAGGD